MKKTTNFPRRIKKVITNQINDLKIIDLTKNEIKIKKTKYLVFSFPKISKLYSFNFQLFFDIIKIFNVI